LHVIGANATYPSADAPWEAIEAAGYLHLGAPEFMGGEEAAKILAFAREHGVVTSADILAPGEQAVAILDWIAPAFAHLDHLLPNEEQVLALTGCADLPAGCRRPGLEPRPRQRRGVRARRDVRGPDAGPHLGAGECGRCGDVPNQRHRERSVRQQGR
jgi:sugar/nucleoside kinase (ribokinase family)